MENKILPPKDLIIGEPPVVDAPPTAPIEESLTNEDKINKLMEEVTPINVEIASLDEKMKKLKEDKANLVKKKNELDLKIFDIMREMKVDKFNVGQNTLKIKTSTTINKKAVENRVIEHVAKALIKQESKLLLDLESHSNDLKIAEENKLEETVKMLDYVIATKEHPMHKDILNAIDNTGLDFFEVKKETNIKAAEFKKYVKKNENISVDKFYDKTFKLEY